MTNKWLLFAFSIIVAVATLTTAGNLPSLSARTTQQQPLSLQSARAKQQPMTPKRGSVKWHGRRGKSLLGDQVATPGSPLSPSDGELAELLAAQQASHNAFCHFRSDVDDGIKDGLIQREETRQGHQVNGSYSYSDGYVQRTVHYTADENGYRVLKETMAVIGNGPKENADGIANVQTEVDGQENRYSISAADLTENNWTNKTTTP